MKNWDLWQLQQIILKIDSGSWSKIEKIWVRSFVVGFVFINIVNQLFEDLIIVDFEVGFVKIQNKVFKWIFKIIIEIL